MRRRRRHRSAAALGLASPTLARPAAKPIIAKPVAAHGIDPIRVLAGSGRGFDGRTASLTSIMGPETGRAVRMNIPVQPEHPRGLHREADATGNLR